MKRLSFSLIALFPLLAVVACAEATPAPAAPATGTSESAVTAAPSTSAAAAGGPCVQKIMCMAGAHFDATKCTCVCEGGAAPPCAGAK